MAHSLFHRASADRVVRSLHQSIDESGLRIEIQAHLDLGELQRERLGEAGDLRWWRTGTRGEGLETGLISQLLPVWQICRIR